ncbi:DUF4136 domain-containing protein [Hymenobacter nivis]|uniref:DUF4136 domain-containing protein n=1 Tax=Hymenobacter nivis TaxID=1850093 RepID=A0A2Z3GWA9_9BACT|nr:DUF4136 domain-containing protein [Hymenobacter nivis]AWM33694.1 hypothetical protein DDQ68_13415 [Hymenobacter nivis]
MSLPFQLLKKPLLALALGLAAGAPAWAQATQTDQKTDTDFTRYKTYNFMDEAARNDSASADLGANIFDLKRAVVHEMEARGYQRAAQPDLLVNIGISTRLLTQTRETNFLNDGAPYYIGQRNYRWQAQNIPVGHYRAGTATIDVVDAARREQVWQGTTTTILSRKPNKAAQQIDKGVAEAFAKFPARAR